MIGEIRVYKRLALVGVALFCGFALVRASESKSAQPKSAVTKRGQTDWPVYGGSSNNIHYSRLNQINTKNVARLEKTWSFDTGEKGGLETSPIIVDGVLYAYTPTQKVIALDASTGKLIWKFASPGGAVHARAERGLAYWRDGNDRRILAGVANYVYAIDATTGKAIASFGKDGRIDLRDNLRGDPESQSVSITSPGVIYKDLIILGDATPEQLPAPPGDIRAYDVRTGNFAGLFTRSHTRASSVTTHGRRTHGHTVAPRTTGAA